MSLFEDLVEELKEENLLEETVIESRRMTAPNGVDAENGFADPAADTVERFTSEEPLIEFHSDEDIDEEFGSGIREFELEDEPEINANGNFEPAVAVDASREQESAAHRHFSLAQKHPGESGKQYFRRRASEEVKTLQMVDHILTRVEKEQAKINSAPFDDLKVKQALHRFLQLDDEANASEVAEIEFVLLQETESWYSALTLRDKELSVEHLRSYCDSTVPSLSTQALLAIARFYRNAPYSELVRSKFDLIITKLYTKASSDGKRHTAMPTKALEADIKELYKEWSSIPLYAAEADDKELEFGAMGFQDFVEEARRAHSFDDLMSKDFFKRLNDFKARSNESFFAPHVVAAAIDCNVAVGNRYIELIENEHGGHRPDALTDKYGFLSDSAITEAIRKVFSAHEAEELAKVEKAGKKKPKPIELFDVEKLNSTASKAKEKAEWYMANKKLVVATVVTVLLGLFYFFFSGYLLPSNDDLAKGEVQEISLENSEFSNYITSAKISKDTAYAITNDSWERLAKPEKEDVMKKFLAAGTNKGFSQINFLDSKGRKVGYASVTRLEIDD